MNERKVSQILRASKTKPLPLAGRRLQGLLQEFSDWMSQFSISVRTETSEYARQVFCRLRLVDQRRILRAFQTYFDLIKDLEARGQDPWDSKRLLWAYLSRTALRPPHDLLSQLPDRASYEILSRDYFQLFRSLDFFEVFEGSVFDLLVLDWMTLYRRPADLEEKTFLLMEDSFKSGALMKTFDQILPHRAELRFSPNNSSEVYFMEHMRRVGLKARKSKASRADALFVCFRWLRDEAGKEDRALA